MAPSNQVSPVPFGLSSSGNSHPINENPIIINKITSTVKETIKETIIEECKNIKK
ncbi:MAG: hypothetical protein FWD78_12115 [Treponema sp.]|nr:hypothetical protein [Treponema sp.]